MFSGTRTGSSFLKKLVVEVGDVTFLTVSGSRSANPSLSAMHSHDGDREPEVVFLGLYSLLG